MLRKTRNLFNCLSEWVNTKKNNEWAVTLDMWKEGDGEETTEVYTNLGQKFGTILWEKFGNCEFIDDSCDGREYAVGFS